MKYLITGCAGFIGKHLVKKLLEQNQQVIGIDRKEINLKHKNFKYIKKDLTKMKIFPVVDVVVHLAAYNGTRFFYEKPIEVIDSNINSTLNLIKFYTKNKCKLFVYAGSPESITGATDYFNMPLPSKESYPIVIDDITNPRWSYANSKALSEQVVINSGLIYCIMRYHNVYGPGQKDHFISDFIERCKKGIFEITGYTNTRSFMYIDDAIIATMKIINSKKNKNQIVNVGNDCESTIKTVATTIMKLCNYKKKLILKPAPRGSASRRVPDITKLKKIFKFTNFTKINEGLKKTIKFYK
jgi:nucleoside-diphosphate-sugar epimerase